MGAETATTWRSGPGGRAHLFRADAVNVGPHFSARALGCGRSFRVGLLDWPLFSESLGRCALCAKKAAGNG